jgi:UDP-arabinose 4-epimerase
MPTVLVAGGAGYIGSHVCKALAQSGFAPVCLDNLSTGHRWAVRWGEFEYGDILDAARVDEVFRRHQPVAVVHLAASAYVGESVRKPAQYYRNNVSGSQVLLSAAVANGVRHVVFSSTCAVYGDVAPAQLPIDENLPCAPVNPYGRSKLAVEWMLSDYGRAYGLNAIAFRYFNAAGADPDLETGEWHDPETHLIPLALLASEGTGPALQVFGTDYPTTDGTCVRDYVHVSDIASAHVAGVRHLLAGGASGVFNLGTGRGCSVREVIDACARVTGKPVPHELTGRREGDPAALFAQAERAKAVLGWSPRFSAIDDMVATAWKWLPVAKTRIGN